MDKTKQYVNFLVSLQRLESISASSSSVINEDNPITSPEVDESVPPKLDVVTGEEGEINIYRVSFCEGLIYKLDNF